MNKFYRTQILLSNVKGKVLALWIRNDFELYIIIPL